MTRRRLLLVLALNLAVTATAAWPEKTNRVPIVGVLTFAAGPDDPTVAALRQGLRELGYVEGRDIRFEFRTAQGQYNRMPRLAEELVQLKVDVIVTGNPVAAQVVRRVTPAIPIVIANFDPVGSGLVTNLAHPGGSITGLSSMSTELIAKRLQLLKETIPRLTRVAVLWSPLTPPTPLQTMMIDELNAAAASLSIELMFVRARTPEDFGSAFSTISRANVQALYLLESAIFYSQQMTLATRALKVRLPAIYAARSFADSGGLMSYGVDYADQWHRAAVYVDKILKGAKPGDLPIEQPTKFELVVNLKTARVLGLTIPESILVLADEVIK